MDTNAGRGRPDLRFRAWYALFCNFQDAPDKPEHVALGMCSGRTVTATPQ
ncbi:MAG: hypothetical protein ACKVZ0_12210 [Gemmatimonadales bacterium]